LLGLVIERPSYAYELARRFERTYEGVLSLSSISHVYVAVGALKGRSLIEEIPGTGTERQPKPHYRATEKGMEEYRAWLVGQVGEDRRRQRLFAVQLAALTRDPQSALEIVADFEQACEREVANVPTAGEDDGVSKNGDVALRARLISEENRLMMSAKRAWIEYARGELEGLRGKGHRASREASG
jgi:DNA-binding PadR family transcriptional regulator